MDVARYFIRRVLTIAVALWLVVTITFIIMHSVPGGPFQSEKAIPPAIQDNLNRHYNLDEPAWKQYCNHLVNLAHGDFGPSLKCEKSVNEIIRTGFPVSASLGVVAVCIALLGGITAGIVSALHRNRWPDRLLMVIITIGISIPSFILASFLIYLFTYRCQWFPPAMWGTWQHAVLPALALAALPMGYIARLTRAGMLDALQQDYIRTAFAKGLPASAVIFRHALRNALTPVITYLGPLIALVFTGSFVVEHIFAIPGLGRHFVTSIENRDYPLIMGTTVFYSAFLMMMNLIVDITYTLVDPRVRLKDRRGI